LKPYQRQKLQNQYTLNWKLIPLRNTKVANNIKLEPLKIKK